MGQLNLLLIEEPEIITIQYETACINCGKINNVKHVSMNLEEFNKRSTDDPTVNWKESKADGKILYRHYEESSSGHCHYSC